MKYRYTKPFIHLRGAQSYIMHKGYNGEQFYLEYVYPSTIDEEGLKRNRYEEKVEAVRNNLLEEGYSNYSIEGLCVIDKIKVTEL